MPQLDASTEVGESAAGTAPRVLLWCDTTAAVPFETGIQRVTRRLASGLVRCGLVVVAAGWDRHSRLMSVSPGQAAARPGEWLLVPEIPMTAVRDGVDVAQVARAYGLRVAAVVHDLIPLRRPYDYNAADLEVYRRYFRMFAGVEIVLATTKLVASHLQAYLATEGLRAPAISVVPLPAQFADLQRTDAKPAPRRLSDPLRLLTVSTWEPRKNVPVLVQAVGRAQRPGHSAIHLTIVGRRAGFPAYDSELMKLASAAFPGTITVVGQEVSDAELATLYRDHHLSAYPSVEEGFGLPIGESLWLGRPCLCHAGSAMAEVAPGGGTVMLDMTDPNAVAECLMRLVDEPELLERLSAEINARPLRAWSDYGDAVAGVILPPSVKPDYVQ